MNILFVCKRYYTAKDVIRDQFGRLYEIPRQLSALGHEVTVLCLDYRGKDPVASAGQQFDENGVRWLVVSLRDVLRMRFRAIHKQLKGLGPDVVIGSSDIPCLWLSRLLARRERVPYIVDLYDNYQSFGQARIPGFRLALRLSIRDARGVLAVSGPLKEKVVRDFAPKAPVVVLNNGISRSVFCEGDRLKARNALGLPLEAHLIGTAGNLSAMKGLDTVYAAWPALESVADDLYLVLAGKVDPELPVPLSARVIYLGELAEHQVAELFRALDLGIIPAHDSEFGRYCFPQKLFEMVGCGLPVVAARVGAIAETLQAFPGLLFTPGDADSLRWAVTSQLAGAQHVAVAVDEWPDLVKRIDQLISQVV
ncbi:glycosyltransferase family 4 protein [Halopseudomonas aestusnigri]|uniref:glycosyltransferase family 4 protein n=1 Tax=Halopseudomonas aestusnigri TaxID=857252 RepID=UPI0028C07677|nr:hypothetical protein YSKK_21190 [Halopseudomonas aestusnigri]